MTKNILKSKLTKPLKYKAKLQISIKDQNGSESSHNPKVIIYNHITEMCLPKNKSFEKFEYNKNIYAH